ncbi:hypothetical protein QOZ80_7AG0571290 [Eleusine coracana subsp. coracana]|nr:hypothetical protein QOZ80_7AG0571290 [Eleusine coracana subsp. coracana]
MTTRCRRPGEDRISGLPDELLHSIFARLGSIRAAARTCVLSQRWRRVWEHLSALVLFHHDEPLSTSFVDSVDAVLATYSSPAIGFLRIKPPKDSRQIPVPAHRVAPWLRFASERVVGSLYLYMPGVDDEENREEELQIPVCDRATVIHLSLGLRWRLRLQPTGLFTALSALTIRSASSIDGTELTALVSTQCPCLRVLVLFVRLRTFSDVSMRTDSLLSLWFEVKNTRNLEVVAPRLERLGVRGMESHMISTPKLAELQWNRQVYDPSRHQYVDVGRHIRLLELGRLPSLPLLQRFDRADKLQLNIAISQVRL